MQAGQSFNPYRLFNGSYIPDCILSFPGLSSSSKLIWARLAKFAGESGECFPSQKRLAEETGVSERAVRYSIEELVRQGFLEVKEPLSNERLAHRTSTYTFLWHPVFEGQGRASGPDRQKLPVPPAKIAGDIDRGVKESQLRESSPQPPRGGPLPSRPSQNGKEEGDEPVESSVVMEFLNQLRVKTASNLSFKPQKNDFNPVINDTG